MVGLCYAILNKLDMLIPEKRGYIINKEQFIYVRDFYGL